MRRVVAVAALLAAGAACAAPAAGSPCDGTWEGRLGASPVMLQFNWDGLGSYYLGTALVGAVLRPGENDPQAWEEYDEDGRRTGSLRLECAADAVRGERTSTGGQRSALQGRRVEDNSFNRRRLGAVDLVPQRTLSEQGRVLEVIAARGIPQIVTLRIRQPGAGEAAVNQRLRAALLQQLDNHLQCQALVRAKGRFAPAGGDTLSLQRLDWRGSVLSAQFWLHGNCGNPEGYAGPQQFTFDTATGEELPLPRWLLPEYRDGAAAGSALYDTLVLPQVLRGRRKLEDLPEARRECGEFELAEKAVPLAVEDRGMVFGFHYSLRMAHCGIAFVAPWAALEAFLSDDGRRWREAMRPAPRR
ncbi:hypothetical protein GCM10028796_46510 [Ramlibacter monticola]|uniref:DUF3298 domain-containing protein n=1 Tax=Ramlibacter monticola TaxID=1926872 RepID=A0A936Z3F7_9BURK|nr:hypothetical protein [Ramlibacter monticola]MBL0393179.1 hypothetical protein [Ramlibacter monticola]